MDTKVEENIQYIDGQIDKDEKHFYCQVGPIYVYYMSRYITVIPGNQSERKGERSYKGDRGNQEGEKDYPGKITSSGRLKGHAEDKGKEGKRI